MCCHGLALVAVAAGAQPAFQVADVDSVSAICWVPGTHTLLLLSQPARRLSLLDADCSPPAVLHSAPVTALQGCSLYLAAALCGSVAFIVSARRHSTGVEGALSLHDPISLQRQSGDVWHMPQSSAWVSPAEPCVVCSQLSVVASFHGVGTRVWSYSGCNLGPALFWAEGLDSAAVCMDGHFLAGIRDSYHEVLDGCSGDSLFKLPKIVPQHPPATPASMVWAGPDSCRLHACYTYSEPGDTPTEDSVLLYKLLSFRE